MKIASSIRERNGCVDDEDKLVAFLYLLMRDHVVPGTLEEIMKNLAADRFQFSNGWLALYAKDIAGRLGAQ